MLAEGPAGGAWGFFGLDPGRRTLLVMGGSQGASGVNRAVAAALSELDASATQVIWLTGVNDEGMAREAVAAAGVAGFVAAFHGRLDLAYRIADVCVARSGGSSLAELAHFGIATVLIPLPTAAEDHQTRNAEVFARAGAAVLLPQVEATGERLGGLVRGLLEDDGRRGEMARRFKAMGVADAATRVAEAIEETVGGAAGERGG
jgi:UDP-N-acetylglucosamine--N-acetylmuramyl-(pentapeptide) pyrophosphoryl-undecaprenol N-acetylglucosamine transferase